MIGRRTKRTGMLLAAGLAVALMAGLGATVGVLVGHNWTHRPTLELPAFPLHATATHGNDSFAIATGSIDENEGVFLLDFLTGELSCYVLNYRTGTFNAKFMTNVVKTLGVEQGKKPRYLMTTGLMNVRGTTGASRPANSLLYVVDANSGNFAAYAIPWNRTLASSGRPQAGQFMLIDVGKARQVEIGE